MKTAANLSLERLQSGLKELENGVELINSEVAQSREVGVKEKETGGDGQEKQLLHIMSPFYEKAESEVNGLRKVYDTTLTKLKHLAVYYGETLKEERLIELFKTMREFLFMFDQVSTELKESRRREDEAANKRAAFYSCPASPAKGSGPGVVTSKDPHNPTAFQLTPPPPPVPLKDAYAKPVDLRITSLLKNNHSFPFFRADLPTNAVAELETKTDQYSSSSREELKTISNPLWNDNTDDSQNPHLSNNVCYDSDWSTG